MVSIIEIWRSHGQSMLNVRATLSEPLLPGCSYLLISKFKSSYWVFNGWDHLLFDRAIDQYKGYRIFKCRWHSKRVDQEWFRQKGCWTAVLDWADENEVLGNLFVGKANLLFSWNLTAPFADADEEMVFNQIRSIVKCVNESR